MPPKKNQRINPAEARAAVQAVAEWIRHGAVGGEDSGAGVPGSAAESAAVPPVPTPGRSSLAAAVRMSARLLAQLAPGYSVELRIPPFVAVQCIEGPEHTRGTPPNVVEMDPHTWLQLVAGETTWEQACARGRVQASGIRSCEIARWLPLVGL